MNEKPRYFKKEYRCVVLSQDEEIDDIEFIGYNVADGDDCLHTWEQVKSEELTGKQAADLLIDAGSEPGFFSLDEDGNSEWL